ncbi:UDP-glucose:glycoprotein glucosyltransferase 1, partial [Varanus komodoensis]
EEEVESTGILSTVILSIALLLILVLPQWQLVLSRGDDTKYRAAKRQSLGSQETEQKRLHRKGQLRSRFYVQSGVFFKMGTLIALIGIWVSFSLVKADSKAVTTSLTTKWPSTPLLLEASEFLAEDGQEKFWNFVETCQDFGSSHRDGTDSSSYYAMLEAASQSLSSLQKNLLKFALSLRSYSATVQAFQQIAADEPPPEGCNAFFVVHGKKTCDSEKLGILLQTASERPKPFMFKGDHKYPVSNPESPVVILYAEIGSKEFSRFHKLLVEKATAGEVTYVLRHYIANPSKEKVYLSGYGVELAIKSTEYKAKDDTQVKGTDVNATVIGENDPIDEVQGFLFGKLRQLHPTLKEELKELRKHLIESTNEMAPLKVWQLQDLSFQTAARILAAPTVDALMVMKDLSQNFPTKARAITKTVVSSELRSEIEENQKECPPRKFMVMSFSAPFFLHYINKLEYFKENSDSILLAFRTYDSFIRPVTFWIVGDFGKPSGRQLLYDAIKHQTIGSEFSSCPEPFFFPFSLSSELSP